MLKKKTFVAFGLVFSFIGGLTLAGCGPTEKTQQGNQQGNQNQNQQGNQGNQQGNTQGNQNQGNQNQGNQGNQGNQQGNQGSQGGQENPPKPADDFSKANAFLQKLGDNNFSYNSGNVHVERQGDLISYAEPSFVDYYQRSNGQTYTYTFQNSDQMWHKKVLAGQDIFPIVDDLMTSFLSVQWSAQNNNTYTGSSTLGQLKLTLKDEFSGTFNALGQNVEVFDVGRTVVSLPAQEQTVDETVAKPDAKKLYEVVNGQKQWNFPLLKETLQTWMIENDYLTRWAYGVEGHLDEIAYLNVKNDGQIEFFALMNTKGKKLFQTLKLNDAITNQIKIDKIATADDLKNTLTTEVGPAPGFGNKPIMSDEMAQNFEYSTLDDDYGTHQVEFEKMTQNIFNRLETIGYQSGSIDDPGTIVTDYKDAKFLFGMKITYSGKVVPGFDMGYVDGWQNCYLLDLNGNVEFVSTKVIADANTSKLPIEYVLENTNQRKWLISSIETKELQKENLDLYTKTDSIKSKE